MSFEDMRRRVVASEDMDFSDDAYTYESQTMFDFTSVALYVPAIQVVVSTVASCTCALLLTWLPLGSSNAVRTLALSSVVGLVPIIRPIRVARTRGIDALFTMIRPVVVVYLISMIVEQLGHSCEQWQAKTVGSWREIWYHVIVFVTMVAGFARSYAPHVDDDMPLIVACTGMLLIALVPHSAHEYGGPLCATSSLFHATERILRAFMFATVYCVIACAGEILMPRPNGLFVASIRACGASIWILACSVWILPLAAAQIVLVVWSRVRHPLDIESMPITSPCDSDMDGDSDHKNVQGLDNGVGNGVGNGPSNSLGNGFSNGLGVCLGNGNACHNGGSEVDLMPFRLSLKGQTGGSCSRPSVDQMRQMADSI